MKTSDENPVSMSAKEIGMAGSAPRREDEKSNRDWFQQIHGSIDGDEGDEVLRIEKADLPMWHELFLIGLAILLICYCYYTSN